MPLALHIHGFHIHRFNQLQIEKYQKKSVCTEQAQVSSTCHYSLNNREEQIFTEHVHSIRWCK
jgi:hypothetical protein